MFVLYQYINTSSVTYRGGGEEEEEEEEEEYFTDQLRTHKGHGIAITMIDNMEYKHTMYIITTRKY